MKGNAKSLFLCLAAMPQDRCVVAADLSAASALRSCSVEVFQDQGGYRVDAMVNSSRHHEDQESVFFRRVETKLSTRTKQERADIHARSSSMRWDKFGVETDSQVYALLEVVDRDLGHANKRSRMLHAFCVLLWSEDANGFVVWTSGCLESLVALHTVVKPRRHAVKAQEGILDEFWWRPFSCLNRVGRLNVPVHCPKSERNGLARTLVLTFTDSKSDVVPISMLVSTLTISGFLG